MPTFSHHQLICPKCCLKVRAHVVEKLIETGKGKRLKGFELVKGVHLEPEPFSGTLFRDDLAGQQWRRADGPRLGLPEPLGRARC